MIILIFSGDFNDASHIKLNYDDRTARVINDFLIKFNNKNFFLKNPEKQNGGGG